METSKNIPVVTGAAIGVLRLKTLIAGAKLEQKGMRRNGQSCLSILKRELGVKGNADRVIAIAEVSLANVAHW